MASPRGRERRSTQVTVVTAATVSFTVLGVAALAYFFLKTTLSLLLTIGALMLAVALDHLVALLVRRGLRRSLAIVAVLLGVMVVLAGLALLLIPPAVSQAKKLVAEAPLLTAQLQQTRAIQWLNARFDLQGQLQRGATASSGALTPVLAAIGSVLSVLGGLVTLLFLTIFVLIFGPDLKDAFLAELEPDNRVRYIRILEHIYSSVGGYLQGLLGICTINAALTTTFLAITGMPFFLPLGILSGASSLIPYAGPLIVGAAITLLALVKGSLWKAVATAIYFVLYGQLEGNVLGPLVYRRIAHVNPLLTLLAIMFLAEFMGLAGAIIAVPIAAVAQIVLGELLSLRKQRQEGVWPPDES
jgi:predicted PurR-regulated permease PerM